ncbi:4'-phosphopantetheinyl transferase family protein [Bordetella genomosp. 10]|uniref:4'-phosphopantetheinyl transferase family protein n=1 Tax=Bordetella genomosp. 10 TaxID=1416804 RepID=UPI000B9EB293|nr:4'-phosphopantetheinyl transferase superfamily protein [Bordetella genomosp. 10]
MSESEATVPRHGCNSDPAGDSSEGADRGAAPVLLWGGPAAAADYDPAVLSDADAARAGLPRTPRAALQWRVSRAALRQAGAGTRGDAPRAWSLSHSDGHALVARAPAGWRVGVDLERRRPRDVAALAQWCCDAGEQAHLAALPEARRLAFFYRLWTLKEAFIKAAGLDFPADMRSVGLQALQAQAAGRWTLRAPAGAWRARCWEIGEDWVASVAWSVDDGAAAPGPAGEPAWRTARGCVLPPVRLVYADPED